MVFLLGCFGSSSKGEGKENCCYGQDFETPVAWLVIEWNGKPHVIASGFLVQREKGIFITARHFTDVLNNLPGPIKVFFNGRVYDAELIRVPPLRDVALIRLRGNFDYRHFPQPVKLARTDLRVGDTVFARGFHRHPYISDSLGYGTGVLIDVLLDYYGIVMFDPTKRVEVVFHNLEGRVINLAAHISIRSGRGGTPTFLEEVLDSAATYIEVRIESHRGMSFAGLSGGGLFNDQEELLAVITAEIDTLEYDPRGRMMTPFGSVVVVRQVWEKLYNTPVYAIRDLLDPFIIGNQP